jgi:hypothetical protein
MSPVSRRQLLKLGLAEAAALMVVPGRSRAAPRSSVTKPGYIVQIMLSGGIDSVLTVDPKDPTTPHLGIDCGYTADARLKGERRLYGPLFAPLLEVEQQLCLVHGVRVDTVSHPEAHTSVSRGRITFLPSTYCIGDALGACLPGNAMIHHLNIGGYESMVFALSPRARRPTALSIDPQQIGEVAKRRPPSPWQRQAAALLVEARSNEAQRLFGSSSELATQYTNEAALGAAQRDLFAGLPGQNRFTDPEIGPGLHVALHALKEDKARFIHVGARYLWFDSHTDNFHIQSVRLKTALADIATFIRALKTERNAFGPLIEQTTVVIGSELGRFPRLNGVNGKDHWPENSWILVGRGIRPVPGGLTLGETDNTFRGREVDYQSGSTTSGNRRPLYLDSLFATLIKIAGGDPARYEYPRDATLDFLLS